MFEMLGANRPSHLLFGFLDRKIGCHLNLLSPVARCYQLTTRDRNQRDRLCCCCFFFYVIKYI